MKAPDFSLKDQYGKTHTLEDYTGRWLVLYFYPKDETLGCTQEACSFRDAHEVIHEIGKTEVVGISKDSIKSHKDFSDRHQLSFTLLSDPKHEAIEAYGAWKDSSGTDRDTFIINPQGEIAKEYRGVDPAKHVVQIVRDLNALYGAF